MFWKHLLVCVGMYGWELALFLHHIGFGTWTPVSRLHWPSDWPDIPVCNPWTSSPHLSGVEGWSGNTCLHTTPVDRVVSFSSMTMLMVKRTFPALTVYSVTPSSRAFCNTLQHLSTQSLNSPFPKEPEWCLCSSSSSGALQSNYASLQSNGYIFWNACSLLRMVFLLTMQWGRGMKRPLVKRTWALAFR